MEKIIIKKKPNRVSLSPNMRPSLHMSLSQHHQLSIPIVWNGNGSDLEISEIIKKSGLVWSSHSRSMNMYKILKIVPRVFQCEKTGSGDILSWMKESNSSIFLLKYKDDNEIYLGKQDDIDFPYDYVNQCSYQFDEIQNIPIINLMKNKTKIQRINLQTTIPKIREYLHKIKETVVFLETDERELVGYIDLVDIENILSEITVDQFESINRTCVEIDNFEKKTVEEIYDQGNQSKVDLYVINLKQGYLTEPICNKIAMLQKKIGWKWILRGLNYATGIEYLSRYNIQSVCHVIVNNQTIPGLDESLPERIISIRKVLSEIKRNQIHPITIGVEVEEEWNQGDLFKFFGIGVNLLWFNFRTNPNPNPNPNQKMTIKELFDQPHLQNNEYRKLEGLRELLLNWRRALIQLGFSDLQSFIGSYVSQAQQQLSSSSCY